VRSADGPFAGDSGGAPGGPQPDHSREGPKDHSRDPLLRDRERRPIPLSAVPDAAVEFANELLGWDGVNAFFERYYKTRRVIGY
jgi:hypothetical protein